MNWLDVLSSVCLILGALSCLMGAVGLLSFPDVTSRLQAATKPQTLGLILILAGTGVHLEVQDASGLILVALLQMLTSPVLAQLVGRAAYRSGNIKHERLVVDELGTRLHREDALRGRRSSDPDLGANDR